MISSSHGPLLTATGALAALLSFAPCAAACEFCSMQGQTLLDEVNQASMVLYGRLANAKLDPEQGAGQGTTDLVIEEVVKKNDILGGRKTLTLPKYLPDEGGKVRYLLFCDVYKGKVDPYRGVPVKVGSDIVAYLRGALQVKDRAVADRLRYYFKFLDSPELDVGNDAYRVFANADSKDVADMAKGLPPDTIGAWLRDPNTPAYRFGLYAMMLGYCGKDRHADLLRQMLDDEQKRLTAGVDGILAGYTMLRPKEGWTYVRGVLADPTKEFGFRYAALRAARFFWTRPELVDHGQVVEGVAPLLDDPNIADLAVEDLRKWGRWELRDRVFHLGDRKTHEVPVIRRAILKYALTCPGKEAAAFVAGMRKQDPEMVADTEEWLKLEAGAPAVKPAGKK